MENIKSFIKNIDKYKVLIFICISIGIILRILFYFYNRPFWNDECALAINIHNSWNYFKPLQYNQATPQLFMYLSKLAYMCPPPAKELLLRALPLICSIISIWLFYILSEKFLTKNFSKIVSVLMFSICYPLCYYAQEFKQYSSDVLCFLLILLSYFYIKKLLTSKTKILNFGLIVSLLTYFSFTTLFALPVLFLMLFIFKREVFWKIKIALIPIITNFIIFYLINMNLSTNEILHSYWSEFFVSKNLSNLFSILFTNINYFFNSKFALILIIFTIIYTLFKDRKNQIFYLIFFPLILAMLLAYFNIYPFGHRLILYLSPVFILLTSKTFDYINFNNKFIQYVILFIITIILLVPSSAETYNRIIKKTYISENIITPLQIAASLAKKDEIIYISQGSQILYEYYKHKIQTNAVIIIENNSVYNNNYINNLEKLEKGKTYYYIYAHYREKLQRLNSVYKWAKSKKDFKIYVDNNLNALIIFTN